MEELLNLGLNFAVLPLKLDITQILVDFKKFERNMVWHEFWFGKEDKDENYEPPVFKTNKTNFPKKYNTPEGLKTMLGAVKSEINDPTNRNKAGCNIPKEMIIALKELVNLQKQRKIVIKRCDKGAGIIILDFEEYMHAFYTHLNSRLKNADGSTSPYYIKSDVTAVNTANENLEKILQEAKDNYLITNAEYDAMLPEGKKLAKFYCTFKVHKEHKHGEAPPERTIVSGCGATFENANKFIEHHIKHIATTHPTYLQDTPDFLRYIEEINHDGELPDNAILVTFDVVGLFTNIPEEAGLEALREALMERTAKDIPTEFLVRLMQLILQNNFFEFTNNDNLL